MKKFADGGAAQQVTQFQPTFSPAQQGIGSLQQEPTTPAMEGSPTDYSAAPTQQYGAPATSYSAPAPMTAGLGSYMEGLQYKAPVAPAQTTGTTGTTTTTGTPTYNPKTQTYTGAGTTAPAPTITVGGQNWTQQPNGTWNSGSGELGFFDQNFIDTLPASDVTTSTTAPATTPTPITTPSSSTTYNPDTQTYTAPTAPTIPTPTTPTAPSTPNYTPDGYFDSEGRLMRVGDDGQFYYPLQDTGGGIAAGGRIHSYAQGGSIPQGIASLGRGQDSMLVHMTPGEVQGLQQLAMRHGGSLTINPQTGLPEAGILSSLLPLALGFAIGPAGFGLASTSLGAAAAVGGLGALATGSLGKGLMYGLGAYGGSELAGGLQGIGAQQAQGLAATDLANATEAATASTGSASADTAFKQAQQANIDSLVNQAAANPNAAMTSEAYRDFLTNQAPSTIAPPAPEQIQGFQRDAMQQLMQNPQLNPATQQALARSPFQNSMQGLKEITGFGTGTASDAVKSGLGGFGSAAKMAGMALAPAIPDLMKQNTLNGAGVPSSQYPYRQYGYSQKVNPNFSQPGQPYYLNQGYTAAAQGGLMGLHEQTSTYAAGGRLLRGPGDGMSDSIPAVIKGARPQRPALADGEFVIPADVVSHLGNGSTEAGSKHLYAMMARIRKARTGNPKQGKQINPNRFMPA